MANLAVGLPVFGLAMGRYGPGGALLAAFLAGAGGNVAGLLLHPHPHRALGASGMVMGALGLLAIQSLSLRPGNPRTRRYILGGSIAGVMLFILLGLDPASDVAAHFGGFVCGLMLGAALTLIPQKRLFQPATRAICGAVLAGLVALTWTLALGHVYLPSAP